MWTSRIRSCKWYLGSIQSASVNIKVFFLLKNKGSNFGWSSPKYSIRALPWKFKCWDCRFWSDSEFDWCWRQEFCWSADCKSGICCWMANKCSAFMVKWREEMEISFSVTLFALSLKELMSPISEKIAGLDSGCGSFWIRRMVPVFAKKRR